MSYRLGLHEPLPHVTDARAAVEAGAPLVHEEVGSNIAWEGLYDWGDINFALDHAEDRQPRAGATREQAVRHGEIRRLALAIRDGGRALKENRAQLQAVVEDMAPGLTDRRGIGPVTAAQVIVGFSHVGRCRNDAAFAALSGTSPLEASSGRTVRHRLNRGGDRALNSALHTIAMVRMRCCPRTKAYVARRTA